MRPVPLHLWGRRSPSVVCLQAPGEPRPPVAPAGGRPQKAMACPTSMDSASAPRLSFLILFALLILAGCGGVTTRKPPIEVFPDMDRQPKYKPQAASTFFGDSRASRSAVAGTVATGQLREDDAFETGISSGMYAGRNPLPIDAALLARGRERYDIYCAVCHDRTGSGRGIVPLRVPSWQPTNLLDERIRKMSDGELFSVSSDGRRTMHGYRFQVSAGDRWAIVAYVRALQRTREGNLADVPPELRQAVR